MAIYRGDMMDDLNDMLMGGMDDDILWGGMGDDTLEGGAGNDRLIGGPGGDKLNGGPGNMDIASYADSSGGVQVDLATTFTDNLDDRPEVRGADAEGDSLTGIEALWGSAFGDILRGNHSPNYLFGREGDDIIHGRGGDDLLRGGADNDQLGGELVGTEGTDEAGNDTLYGDEGADALMGGTGNDMLFGGMGDDVLKGGMDADLLEGGMGADMLDGGGGMNDTAAYTMSSEAVTVDLRFGEGPGSSTIKAPMGGDAMGDTFKGIENLRGSMHDDALMGDDGMAMEDNPATKSVDESDFKTGNKLFGNMGNDMLKGMDGNDTLHGGKGMDTLYGGKGNDTLRGEMGNDALKGDNGDDTLIGGPGADKLFGGEFIAADERPGDDNHYKKGDTADYSTSTEGVTVSLIERDHDDNPATPINIMGMGGDADGDVLVAIEHLTGSPQKDMLEGDGKTNHLKGGGGNDWNDAAIRGKDGGLYGGAGDDTLDGGGGNDWLQGQEGNDTLKGGSGNDMLDGGVQIDADAETSTNPVVTGRKPGMDNSATTEDESLAWKIHNGPRPRWRHKSLRVLKRCCLQTFLAQRRLFRDEPDDTTDCSVPGSVRQAARGHLRPRAGEFGWRGRVAQGGRAGVWPGQGVRPLSGG